MRNTYRMCAVICAGLFLFVGVAQAQDKGIAIIDMNRVFEEYERTEVAKDKMEQQGAAFKAEVSAQAEELQALEEEFNLARQEAYDMALSAEVREQRKTDAEQKLLAFRDKEAEVKQLHDSRKKEIGDISSRLIEAILDEIKAKVDAFAESRGYFLVLDSSGSTFNRLPAVVYHDGSTDITDEVLVVLNSGAGVEAEAPAAE